MIGPIFLLASMCASAASAQTVPAGAVLTAFPADAVPLSREAITERLNGQSYSGTTATGLTWRATYKDSGYVFMDLSNGARDSGTWRAEDGKVCVEYRGRFPSGCSEVRASATMLFSQRENSTAVIAMQKQ